MGEFSIFEPQVSTVSHDMGGKTILVYGSNRTGKTKQATRLPKSFYLAFEKGLNGIAGVPFLPMIRWSDFVKVNKQLTNPKTLEQAKSMYQTIIFDTVEAAGLMCEDYICEVYGVKRIKEGNSGYGLYKEYATEFWKQINLLTSVGYTVVFIAHEGTREFKDEKGEEYVKIYPKGDKRVIDPIVDLVDIICYCKANGLDASNNEIPSSAFLKNTPQYHAGSRFDYMPPFLDEFSADNLQKAIADAVKKQEEVEGIKTVSFAEQQKSYEKVEIPFEKLVEDIKTIAMKMHDLGRIEEYKDIVENYMGIGGSVADAKKSQKQQLELILDDLKNLDLD